MGQLCWILKIKELAETLFGKRKFGPKRKKVEHFVSWVTFLRCENHDRIQSNKILGLANLSVWNFQKQSLHS